MSAWIYIVKRTFSSLGSFMYLLFLLCYRGGNGVSKDCVLTPCNNAKCTVQATCTDNTFSPYAEELRQIVFTVEAATNKRYEKHIKHFYIRDICKYIAVKCVTCLFLVQIGSFNILHKNIELLQ